MLDNQSGEITLQLPVPKSLEVNSANETRLTIRMSDAIKFSSDLESLKNIKVSKEAEVGKMSGVYRMAQATQMEQYLTEVIIPMNLPEQSLIESRQLVEKLLDQKQKELLRLFELKGADFLNSLCEIPQQGGTNTTNILAEIQVLSSILGDRIQSIKDPSEILHTLQQSKKTAIEKLGGKTWSHESKKYSMQNIGGINIDVIRHSDFAGIMQYSPENNAIYIGQGARPYVEAGDYQALQIAGIHESEHAKYMHLSSEQQRSINAALELGLESNPELMNLVADFAQELYTVEPTYLSFHDADASLQSTVFTAIDSKPGIKNRKNISVSVRNKKNGITSKHTVIMSHLLTELFSYSTPSINEQLYERATSADIKSANLVRLASSIRSKLSSAPGLKEIIQPSGILADNIYLPDMAQYV